MGGNGMGEGREGKRSAPPPLSSAVTEDMATN